jgi:16S rRNA (guanine527-N7)-methyltransferase
MPVSRETPPAPDSAQGVFSDALPKAEAFAALLAGTGVERGLIGPREAPRLWERHLVNCAVLGELIPRGASVCDVGSGAGLPGVVLALSRADLGVTLVEPLLRRSRFLEEAVEALDLSATVRVVRARAEDLHTRAALADLTPEGQGFDVVTSRAVAPLPRLLDWSMPLVRAGGVVVAMKGASAGRELEEAATTLARHHAGRAEVLRCGVGVVEPPTTVVRVEVTRPGRLPSGEGTARPARAGSRDGGSRGKHQSVGRQHSRRSGRKGGR